MFRVLLAAVLALPAAAGCHRSETATDLAPSASAATLIGGALVPSARAPAAPAAICPAGKWSYDHADHFLATIARNTPGARVVSERGAFVCTIAGTERGSYICQTSAGGVENVIEAPSGPEPLRVTVKMNGSSNVDFESAGQGRWRTTRADNTTLRTEIRATVGGREVPMPAFNAFPGMDRAGALLEYHCEGDTLKIKPIVEGAVTDYATMKRVQ